MIKSGRKVKTLSSCCIRSRKHKGYGLRRRLYMPHANKGFYLTSNEITEINEIIASHFNFKELFKDAKVLPINENGHYILDPNNPSDRDWMED